MIKTGLTELILHGKFSEAMQLLHSAKLNAEQLEGLMLEIAYDTESIAVYAFVCYLISQNESAELHNVATSLMSNPLCFIEGAYVAGLHHAKRAIELAPSDVSLKELMIFFHIIPDELVSKEEATRYAHQILAEDPQNKAALDFLRG